MDGQKDTFLNLTACLLEDLDTKAVFFYQYLLYNISEFMKIRINCILKTSNSIKFEVILIVNACALLLVL